MTLLQAADWEAEIRPDIGGSISALRYRGVDVLRPMPGAAVHPLEASCFPLVPWCNRVRNGVFEWNGREIRLPRNFEPEPHSLHGLSWKRPWEVESQVDSKCVLVDNYDGNGLWPWAYTAQQRIRLGPKGCAITLVVINRSQDAMPAGIGLHPYFRRREEAAVQFNSDHVLLCDAETMPTGVTAPANHFGDWQAGACLPPETVDHCFAQWQGTATITDDLGAIHLASDGAPNLHLYAPADGSALCLEPVSHIPDALNRAPDQVTILPPGCAASMNLKITAREP